MASWTWRLIGDFSMSNSRNTSKCGTRAVYLANASPSAHTKQAGEVSFQRVRRRFVVIRTEAMGASIEWLDFALYEWNMGDANVGPPSLARCIASLLSRHFKCKLQRNLGVGRAHKEHMAELIKAIKRLSDDSVAAHLEHHLLNTLRTID
jgi:hypothetical protein